MPDPTGYGRVIRDQSGQVVKIVEQKDGSPAELAVSEVNAGIYCFDMPLLWDMLHRVTNKNAQGEYYLTDIIGMLVAEGKTVSAFASSNYKETLGVNSRMQMAEAESVMRQRKLEQIMTDGVTVIDPGNTYVDMIPNCDKIVPGMLMAAGRVNIPAVVVSGGPMQAGRYKGKDISVSTMFEAAGKLESGQITEAEMADMENKACPGCGSCAGLFTANTMNCMQWQYHLREYDIHKPYQVLIFLYKLHMCLSEDFANHTRAAV